MDELFIYLFLLTKINLIIIKYQGKSVKSGMNTGNRLMEIS